jgi:uncharacterized YceG family protein
MERRRDMAGAGVSDLSILGLDDDEQPRRRRHHRRRRRRTPIGAVLSLLVVVVVAVGVVYGGREIWRRAGAAPDYAGSGSGTVYIAVQDGDTAADIGATMLKDQVIKSTRAFRDAAEKDKRALSIQPGTYRLHKHMSGAAALALVLDPVSRVGRVIVPEGLTATQTFAVIAKGTNLTTAELTAASRKTADLGLPSYANGRLEGYLFPTTYNFPQNATAATVLKMMVSEQKKQVGTSGLQGHVPGVALTPERVLIVASLLEKEAITSDFPKVARVIYNRLAKDMPLQLDSTINYALGRNKARVSEDLTRTNSPYNTYLHKGLPPGPIANPGLEAINAALHPANGDWLYFVKADRAGHSFFTADPDAFARQKAKSQAEGVY